MATATFCREADCLNPAARDGRCWGHFRQAQRGTQVRPLGKERPKMTPLERLRKAAIDYRDATAEDDGVYRRADDNLRKAALGYHERRKGRG